jgi:tRNA pseudouridine55 synthase
MNEGGVLLLDKSAGISSFQALRPVKRAFPKTKIGHAGTLDPAATGLLLVGIGGATRLLEYLEGMPKTYSFIARFGMTSDSYDMESPLTMAEGNAAHLALSLGQAMVEKALMPFRGPIRQTPPDYSAIKIQGERACDRVRAGETVTLASREVVIYSLELVSFTPATSNRPVTASAGTAGDTKAFTPAIASIVMTCSKGTYVRSLVHDLGQALGCGAVTDKIRRLAIGPFQVENAQTPDSPNLDQALLPLDTAVAHLPEALLSTWGVAAFLNGRAIDTTDFTLSKPLAAISSQSQNSDLDFKPDSKRELEYRAMDTAHRLIAIATLSPQGLLCPKKVLVRS